MSPLVSLDTGHEVNMRAQNAQSVPSGSNSHHAVLSVSIVGLLRLLLEDVSVNSHSVCHCTFAADSNLLCCLSD